MSNDENDSKNSTVKSEPCLVCGRMIPQTSKEFREVLCPEHTAKSQEGTQKSLHQWLRENQGVES